MPTAYISGLHSHVWFLFLNRQCILFVKPRRHSERGGTTLISVHNVFQKCMIV